MAGFWLMPSSVNIDKVVDEIYQASVTPERWQNVLHRMAEICDAQGTVMFRSEAGAMRWMCSPSICPAIRDWISSGWVRRNARQRLIAINEPRFLTDFDGFTREELESDPFYSVFLRSHGLGWCVGTVLRTDAGADFVLSVEKAYAKGPVIQAAVDTLDQLRPHLERAVSLSTSIGRERARTVVNVMQSIGIPAAALTPTAGLIVANDHFLRCAPSIQIGGANQVSFADSKAQAAFGEALAASNSRALTETRRSIVVPRLGQSSMLIAHLLSIGRAARDIFSDGTSILLITHLVEQMAPDPKLLANLFELTPTEARVAGLLVEGRSVKAIARMQGVATNTIRMQLKSVFNKTGVHRQAQLVSLLAQKPLAWLSRGTSS